MGVASGYICDLFSDGSYLYAGLFTAPAKIVKIDLSDFSRTKTLTLDTGENGCRCLCSDGSYLYAGLFTAPAKIVKIDLSDFSKVSTLTLDSGENKCYALSTDGSYLYAGLYTYPAKIVKISLSDFSKVSTLTLDSGENKCYALSTDGSYLYAGLYTSPAKIVKINLSDFSKVSTLTFDTGEKYCTSLFSDGSYLYAGLFTAPAKIVKIDLSDFFKVSTLTLDSGENYCESLFSDGSYLYAGLYTGPAKIVKIDLSDFSKVSTFTFDTGENYCTSLFSDSSYLYAGLYTEPAKIVRRYIYPTNATLRERKIDRVYERHVEQSMPLAFYGTVTTYTDTTHFKVSTLSRFGDDFFNNWYVYVVRDAGGAGAAPQDEIAKISDYGSSDGSFTHDPFTTSLAVGDEVLIVHKLIAEGGTSSETEGTATGLNAYGGTASSSETGADVLTISTTARKNILFLGVDISGLSSGATATIRMYTKVLNADSSLTKFYSQTFTVGTDPDLVPVIDGTMGIRNDLRVEIQSNNAADTSVSVSYFWIEEGKE